MKGSISTKGHSYETLLVAPNPRLASGLDA